MSRSWNDRIRSARDLLGQWLRHEHVRRYGSNSLWLMAARCSFVVAGTVAFIAMARVLGPSDLGTLNYALAIANLLAMLPSLGVDVLVVRDLVRRPEERDTLLGDLFLLRLMLVLAMLAGLYAVLFFAGGDWRVKALCAVAVCGHVGMIMQPAQTYFTATVQGRFNAFGQLAGCLCLNGLRLAAVAGSLPLWLYAAAEAGSALSCHAVVFFIYAKRVASPLRWRSTFGRAWALLKAALPLSAGGLLSMVFSRTDLLMLEYFKGPTAVGYYALTVRISENWAMLGGLLATLFSPAVFAAAKVSRAAYDKQLQRLYFLCCGIMAAVAIGTGVIARPLVEILFGVEYLPAVGALRLYGATLPGLLALHVFGLWAANEDRLWLSVLAMGGAALANLALNAVLIPPFGLLGAAASSVISLPLGLLTVAYHPEGRAQLALLWRSVTRLPSFRLGEHDTPPAP